MEITQLRKLTPANGSKTVAFVDIVTADGIKIRSCRLAKFDTNYVIQEPQREVTQREKDKGFRGAYVKTVQFTNLETQSALLKLAVDIYESEPVATSPARKKK